LRCEDAQWQLTLYVDRELDAEAAGLLEAHLAECQDCRAELERLASTQAAVERALEPPEEDPDAVGRVRREVSRERRLRDRIRPAVKVRALVLTGFAAVLLGVAGTVVLAIVVPLYATARSLEVSWPPAVQDDGPFVVRVRCTDARSGRPLSGEHVTASIALADAPGPTSTATSRADEHGVAYLRVTAPSCSTNTSADLTVAAGSGIAASQATAEVALEPRRLAYVWTDRDVAAAGDSVGIAVLLLHEASLRPAGPESVSVEVMDPHGESILSRQVETDHAGYARTVMRMPTVCVEGGYTVHAGFVGGQAMAEFRGGTRADRRLILRVQPETAVVAAGHPLTVALSAERPAGGLCAGADVRLRALSASGKELASSTGQLDKDGRLRVTLRLGSDEGAVTLRGSVRDADLSTGEACASVTVRRPRLSMMIVPTGGAVIAGRAPLIDVVVLSPSGTPVQARLTGYVGEQYVAMDTGPDGVAQVWGEATAEGGELTVAFDARDSMGRYGYERADLRPAPPGTLIAIPDRGVCRQDESLLVDLFSDADGLAVLELHRDGVPVWGAPVEISGGEGRAYVPVDDRLTGTLALVPKWLEDDGPTPEIAPCVFALPMQQLTVQADGGSVEPGAGETRVSVTSEDGPVRHARVYAATRRAAGLVSPPPGNPRLALLRAGASTPIDGAALDALSRELSSSSPRSYVYRPSRAFLTIAGRPPGSCRVGGQAAARQFEQMRNRQRRLFRSLALLTSVLFGLTLAGLVTAGELRRRGAITAGEDQAARASVRQLRIDLAVSGALLVLASSVAARYQVELVEHPLGPGALTLVTDAAPELPGAGASSPVGAFGLVPECGRELLPGPTCAQSSDARADGRCDLALSLPQRTDTYDLEVLAVTDDGRLGYGTSKVTVRPAVAIEVAADEQARVDEAFAVAVRAANRTSSETGVRVTLAAPEGCEIVDGASARLQLGPRQEAVAYARARATQPGPVRIAATAEWGAGHRWEGTAEVAVQAPVQQVSVVAGAADSEGVSAEPAGSQRPVGDLVLLLTRGREAVSSQLLDSCAPPWVSVDEPAWAIAAGAEALEVFPERSAAGRNWRLIARSRVRDAAESLGAFWAGNGYSEYPGREADPRATALALIGLARAAPLVEEGKLDLARAREKLVGLCFGGPGMTGSERALAAWALTAAGASGESVLPLLAVAVKDASDGRPASAECLALAALAYDGLGRATEARVVLQRLASASEPWSGQQVLPGGRSVFGSTGQAARAEALALCALAFSTSEGADAGGPSPAWFLRRLSELRTADGLFGGASTNAVCGLAVLRAMAHLSDGGRRGDVTVEAGADVRSVTPPLDRWLSLSLSPTTTPIRIRPEGDQPVQYVLLAPSADIPPVRGHLSIGPLPNTRTGQARLSVSNGSSGAFGRAEVRVALPLGIDVFADDLDAAVGRGDIKAWAVDKRMLRVLLGDLAAGAGDTASFRVIARRVPAVAAVSIDATVVPAGAARQ